MLRPIFHRLIPTALFGIALSLYSASVWANSVTQSLPLYQDWSDRDMITLAMPNWTNVPGISGYNVDEQSSDPQQLLNGTLSYVPLTPHNFDTTDAAISGIGEISGGAIFGNPVIALRPSLTYRAPSLLISLTTLGKADVRVRYTLRDMDSTPRDTVARVALQYRIGSTGNFTNVPGAYVADATDPNTATKTTDVSALLPAAVNNQSTVQLRIITTSYISPAGVHINEWIGVDDISVFETPSLSIADRSVYEGNADAGGGGCVTTPMNFTVSTHEPAPPGGIFFRFSTQAGSATSNVDYTHVSVWGAGQATIPEGATSTVVTVDAICDNDIEYDETFTVNLSDLPTYNLDDGVATGTIRTDDITLSIADSSVEEGNSSGLGSCTSTPMHFTVSANTTAPSGGLLFTYATAGLTAGVDDYTPTIFALGTIDPGFMTAQVTIPVTCDDLIESNETFTVTLGDLPGYSLAPNLGYIATGTILDDDRPRLSIAEASALEGTACTSQEMMFTVSLDRDAPPGGLEFTYIAFKLGSDTAIQDVDFDPIFLLAYESGNIEGGQDSTTVPVTVFCDDAIEPNETFTVRLTGGGTTYNTGPDAKGTIINDDGPSISVDDVTQVEGNENSSNFIFRVQLSEPAPDGVSFTIQTSNGTAIASSDYDASAVSVMLQEGASFYDFYVPVYGDTVLEDNQNFHVTVSNAVNVDLSSASDFSATGTILNDDGPTISIADVSLPEGTLGCVDHTTPMVFTVTSSAPANSGDGNGITFSYEVFPGSATYEDNDLIETEGGGVLTGSIPDSYSSTEIIVEAVCDSTRELDETFQVVLSNVAYANPFGSRLTATGTIENDDFPLVPTFDIYNTDNGNTVWEGNGNPAQACFLIHLFLPANATAGMAYGVNFGTVAGTAAANSDFRPVIGQNVVLSADDDSRTICVDIVNDNISELSPETFSLNLSAAGNANGAVIGIGSASVTVMDDDSVSQPTISISANSSVVPESNVQAGFTVRLFMPQSGFIIIPPGTRYTVDVAAALGSSATEGEDFSFNPAVVELSPANREETVYVDIIPDDEPEDTETLVLQLMTPTGGAVIGDAMASTDIVDGLSVTSPTFFISDAEPVWEGNGNPPDQAQFDVSLILPPGSSPNTTYSVTVNSMPGSAASPADFTAVTNQTVVLSGSDDRQTVSVTIVNDVLVEGTENFTLVLSAATGGAVIGDDTGLGTIEDNDLVSTPTFLISSPGDLSEAVGSAEATVSLLLPPGVTGTFEVLVSAETGSGPYAAQEGNGPDSDFTFASQYVQLSNISDNDQVTININNDSLGENTESFNLRLSDPVNISNPAATVIIGDGIGAAAIIDNDGGPTVTDPTGDPFADGFSDGFE